MIGRLLRLPPVLFLLSLSVASILQLRVPFPLGIPSFRFGMTAGVIILCAAVTIAGAAIVEMRRHRTTIEPGRKPTSLVTSGIFAFSRNPLYLAVVLVTTSVALMADSLWFVVAAAVLGFVLDRVVIQWEERTLREVFGEDYASYTGRVRRWV